MAARYRSLLHMPQPSSTAAITSIIPLDNRSHQYTSNCHQLSSRKKTKEENWPAFVSNWLTTVGSIIQCHSNLCIPHFWLRSPSSCLQTIIFQNFSSLFFVSKLFRKTDYFFGCRLQGEMTDFLFDPRCNTGYLSAFSALQSNCFGPFWQFFAPNSWLVVLCNFHFPVVNWEQNYWAGQYFSLLYDSSKL